MTQLAHAEPDAICFDFDYPDRAALRMAKRLKQTYPSLPMIVSTLQHSESLAVWTFRSGFMDYLVKPLTAQSLARCRKVLERICCAKEGQRGRQMTLPAVSIPSEVTSTIALDEKEILPAIYYVADHYQDKISSHDAANACSMSPFRFCRKFKEEVGISFRDYVVRYRLREACRLLENPGTSISEVAYAVGFNDLSYFSRIYKRHFGHSPSASNVTFSTNSDQSPTAQLRLPQFATTHLAS